MKILCRFGIHSWKRWYRGRRSCRRCGKVQTRFKGSFPYLGATTVASDEGSPYKIEGKENDGV